MSNNIFKGEMVADDPRWNTTSITVGTSLRLSSPKSSFDTEIGKKPDKTLQEAQTVEEGSEK